MAIILPVLHVIQTTINEIVDKFKEIWILIIGSPNSPYKEKQISRFAGINPCGK
jgi:GMP synthase-like glutamine amidotransferase